MKAEVTASLALLNKTIHTSTADLLHLRKLSFLLHAIFLFIQGLKQYNVLDMFLAASLASSCIQSLR